MEKKSDKKGEPILNKERTNTANKKQRLSACTEAYKEHIMYTFNAFCRVVIRYATLNSWRDRSRKRQREISFEYLTEEKLVLVRKCVGKVISLTHLPFLHPYCCGNSLYQLLPMRFPSID